MSYALLVAIAIIFQFEDKLNSLIILIKVFKLVHRHDGTCSATKNIFSDYNHLQYCGLKYLLSSVSLFLFTLTFHVVCLILLYVSACIFVCTINAYTQMY